MNLNPPSSLSPQRQDSATDYLAYGLHIRSNQPLPGLAALPHEVIPSAAEVTVWLGEMPDWREAALALSKPWYTTPETGERFEPLLRVCRLNDGRHFRLRYCDETEFVLDRRGTRVWATWPSGLTLEDTATYLLGPVFGFLLRLRGAVCLHASAVELGGRAVALVGPPGAGKSTTAAAFARLGCRVLSDDVVALAEGGGQFFAQPAYPRVRLWPSAVEMLCGPHKDLPRLTPNWEKRYLDLLAEGGGLFQESALPLGAVYLLGGRRAGDAPAVEPVAAQEAWLHLTANTSTNYLLDRAMRAGEFAALGRLLGHVPVRRVVPHADPERLNRLCEVIAADFSTLRAAAGGRRRGPEGSYA